MATTTKKTATKRTTARKPAAKKTAARKPVAKKAAAVKQPAVESMVSEVTDRVEDVADRMEDAFGTAVKFARDAAHTYIGMGFVVQDRLARRDFDKMSYSAFLEDAKVKGHDRVTEIQDRIEPYAKRVTERIEPITERIESNLPKPVKEALETGRERVRELLAV